MLFLLAPFRQRVAAVSKSTNLCRICLAIPNTKMTNGQCKGRHVIRRRPDNKQNFLCMQQECEYNHLICQEHQYLNKDHPFRAGINRRIKDLHAKFPTLKEAEVAQEFALLATSPEVPIYDADLSGISDPARRALDTIMSTVQSLVDKSQHTNPINTTTIFSEHSDLKVHMQRHHADDGGIFQKPKNMKQKHQCDKSSQLLSTRTFLKHHMSEHSDHTEQGQKSTDPSTCNTCRKSFKGRRHMKKHSNRTDGKSRHVHNQCIRLFRTPKV